MLCSELPPRIYESLQILCCLAAAGKPLQAHEVAQLTHLPPAQTPKLLQQLKWAGFVASRRGSKGGFWLSKSASNIRVVEVLSFFAPRNTRLRIDPILQPLARATAKCKKEVSRISIADLAKLYSRKPPQAQQPRKQVRKANAKPLKPRTELATKGADYDI
jgi:DNA-binding IscR family transcriptional regulator